MKPCSHDVSHRAHDNIKNFTFREQVVLPLLRFFTIRAAGDWHVPESLIWRMPWNVFSSAEGYKLIRVCPYRKLWFRLGPTEGWLGPEHGLLTKILAS